MARSVTIARNAVGATSLALILMSASPVIGADLLRGGFYEDAPPPLATVRWDGPYIGGFGGYGDARINFSNFFGSAVENAFRAPAVLNETDIASWLRPSGDSDGRAIYGGFAGYNFQADEVVFGFEVDYTRGELRGTAFDQVGRVVVPSTGPDAILLTGNGTATLEDWMTFRGRAGFTSGIFMPYLTAGVALGRFNVATRLDIIDNAGPDSFEMERERWEPGFVAGAGVDVALGPSFFLRGEYQYITFQRASGARFDVNLIKGAAGLRF